MTGGREDRLLTGWSGSGHEGEFTFFVTIGDIAAMQHLTIALQ
jgi:hypothetical protein